MKNTIILLCLFVLSFTTARAQDSLATRKVRRIQDPKLDLLESQYSRIQRNTPSRSSDAPIARSAKGYRIQIYSGNDRNYANDMRLKFMSSYPQTPCYIQFLSPYYKVRVGDYTSSAEANKKLSYFKRVYSTAFVVPTTVNP